ALPVKWWHWETSPNVCWHWRHAPHAARERMLQRGLLTGQRRTGTRETRMMTLLRNLNIRTAMAGVLICCALLIGALAVLRSVTNASNEHSMDVLDSVNVQQLNEINRAQLLLARARLSMDMAASYLEREMNSQAHDLLRRVEGLVGQSRAHFETFLAVPKEAEGKALADDLAMNYSELVTLLLERRASLEKEDLYGFFELC